MKLHHLNGRVYARDAETGNLRRISDIPDFDFLAAYGAVPATRMPPSLVSRALPWLILALMWTAAIGYGIHEAVTVWIPA